MKGRAAKILSAALLLVFVNFMFSNTVFVHYHLLSEGKIVAHSHPYNPSSHHTHTAKALDLIASLNLAAASADPTIPTPAPTIAQQCAVIENHYTDATTCDAHCSATLRGPPHC